MTRYGRFGIVLFALLVVPVMWSKPSAAADVGAPPPSATPPAKDVAPAAASAPTAASKAQPAGLASGTAAVVLDLTRVGGLVGRDVKSRRGEGMGHIVDVLVSPSGSALAAVIDFGGILGVGSRKVAVDWKALNFEKVVNDGFVGIDLTRDELRIAPEYKVGEPVVVLQSAETAAPPAAAAKASGAKPAETKPSGDATKGTANAAKPPAGSTGEGTSAPAKPAPDVPAAVKNP